MGPNSQPIVGSPVRAAIWLGPGPISAGAGPVGAQDGHRYTQREQGQRANEEGVLECAADRGGGSAALATVSRYGQLEHIEAALKKVDPNVTFAAVESVGPKVSGELIKTAVYAVVAASAGILLS